MVRQCLSQVKGGKLAAKAYPAQVKIVVHSILYESVFFIDSC